MRNLYTEKKKDLQSCLDLIRSNDVICFAGGCNQPAAFMSRFHTIAPRVENVRCIASRDRVFPFITDEGMNGHINTGTSLYGESFNAGMQHGNTAHIVCDIRDYSRFINENDPCNVFIAAATAINENGCFQVGMSQMWEKECLETCSTIILEINENLPRMSGGLEIPLERVTAFYTSDASLLTWEEKEPTVEEGIVSDYIADIVRDGDCIELGTGTLSYAIAQRLTGHRELGLHTEVFTNGIGLLLEKGVITGTQKNIDRGLSVASSALGDQHLYDILRDDPTVAIRPSSYICNPELISSIENMVAINTLIEMDLTGQVAAESIGRHQISGSSGNLAFATGALHSRNGKSILCFPTRTRKGISKIKGQLNPGATVTIPRNYVDYIITEYGVARMKGRSVLERTQQLIAIAHPDDRAELTRYAREQFFI